MISMALRDRAEVAARYVSGPEFPVRVDHGHRTWRRRGGGQWKGMAVCVHVERRKCEVAVVNDRGNEMKRERFWLETHPP